MSHAPVERPAQDRALGVDGSVGAEVVPEAERDGRQLQAAAPRPAVVDGLVSVGGGNVGHILKLMVVSVGSKDPSNGWRPRGSGLRRLSESG